MPGEVPFGRYALLTKIASGGMAELFLARQRGPEGFEKLVAIKRILPSRSGDARFVQLFLEEARLAARLSHPTIAQIYDLGVEGDTYFLAMEFVSGENLGTLGARSREMGYRLPMGFVVKIGIDVCEGLYYAHHLTDPLGRPLRVVHCDVSPQNILVGYDGNVKIVDFGIARAAADPQALGGAVRGKAAYMSPEQVTGQPLDHRSDLFSLGVVLYELVTARRLFARDDFTDTVRAVLEEPIPPPRTFVPELSPGLERVILRLLERERARRYSDARAAQRELEAVMAERGGVPASAALSEFMSVLFQETLQKRVYSERTMTAVIPMPTRLTSIPTVIEEAEEAVAAPGQPGAPTLSQSGVRGPAVLPSTASGVDDEAIELAPRSRGRIMAAAAGAGGVLIGVLLSIWYGVRPGPVPQSRPREVAQAVPGKAKAPPPGPLAVETPDAMAQLSAPAPADPGDDTSPGGSSGERPIGPPPFRRARLRQKGEFGLISIKTDPWTNVTIDDHRDLGVIPINDIKLPAGRHKLRFDNPQLGLRNVIETIDVEANRHTEYRLRLEKRERGWQVVVRRKM